MPVTLFVYPVDAVLPEDFDPTYETGETVSVYRDRFVYLSDPLPDPLPDVPEGETLQELRRVRTGGTDEAPVFEWRARLRRLEDVAETAGGFSGVLYQIPDTDVAFRWARSSGPKLKALHEHLAGIQLAYGALAVVDSDADHAFQPRAVRDAFGWTVAEAIERRDLMASWLANRGYDASGVAAATTEHELVAGIVSALGFEMRQLWRTMIA